MRALSRTLISGFCLIAFAAQTHATDKAVSTFAVEPKKWPGAFSRRSYQLGMTLSEFKNTPYPDQSDWPKSYPVCSNELTNNDTSPAYADLRNVMWINIGAIKCEFFYVSSLFHDVASSGLMLGDVSPSVNAFYFFPPQSNAEPVLFYIQVIGPEASFQETVANFAQRYGNPQDQSVTNVVNGLGITIPTVKITYTNATSSIVLNQYNDTLETFRIDYSLDEVLGRVMQAWKQSQGDVSNRL